MPPIDGLKIVRSSIHGYGMITTRPITRGEIIVYADGVLYSEYDEFDDTYSLLIYPQDQQEEYETQMLLDLVDQTRWMNHRCEPNTEVDTSWDAHTREAHAWWVALRDIAAGEELTYDYAFAASHAQPCTCGARQCRGLIVDPDELDDVPEHYRPLIRRPSGLCGP